MLEMSAWNSLWWPIFVINSVDNIKLPCCTHPLMQHNSFFRNYSPFLLLVSGSAAPVILNIEFFTGIWIFSQILIVLISSTSGDAHLLKTKLYFRWPPRAHFASLTSPPSKFVEWLLYSSLPKLQYCWITHRKNYDHFQFLFSPQIYLIVLILVDWGQYTISAKISLQNYLTIPVAKWVPDYTA